MAALLLAGALGLGAVAVWRRRDLLGSLRDVPAWVLLVAASVATPWLLLPIRFHTAFTAHEDSLWRAFLGEVVDGDHDRFGVNPLLRDLYGLAGRWLPHDEQAFLGVATALGAWLPLLIGLAVRALGGRLLLAVAAGALLVVEPTQAFWRVQAFHVALPAALWAGCLLLAALLARRPGPTAAGAWVLLGSAALTFRPELAGPVVATAALPLALGSPRSWDRRTAGAAGAALVAGISLLVPLARALFSEGSATLGEQSVTAGHLALNLSIPALWWPIPAAAMAALGLAVAAFRSRAALALLGIAALSPLPAALFSDFGPRHLIPATAALVAAIAVALGGTPRRGARVAALLAALGAAALVGESTARLRQYGRDFGYVEQRYAYFPGVPAPTEPAPEGWQRCALYSDEAGICDQSPSCMPIKDLRAPELVRPRWQAFAGCVLLTSGPYDGIVAGTRHERWAALRAMYSVDALGTVVSPNGPIIHLYRLREPP